MKAITELATRPGPALIADPIDLSMELPIPDHQRKQLLAMLALKNGFYSFYGSVHVFPIGRHVEHIDLASWNAPDLWKDYYEFPHEEFFCFAEDILGWQFCVYEKGVGHFMPETGEIDHIADDIEGWAQWILDDPREAGYGWAVDWKEQHGSLPSVGCRLMMHIPAICNGEFAIGNMRCVKAVDAMKYWGTFATLTRDFPEGTQFTIEFVNTLPDGSLFKVGSIL